MREGVRLLSVSRADLAESARLVLLKLHNKDHWDALYSLMDHNTDRWELTG